MSACVHDTSLIHDLCLDLEVVFVAPFDKALTKTRRGIESAMQAKLAILVVLEKCHCGLCHEHRRH